MYILWAKCSPWLLKQAAHVAVGVGVLIVRRTRGGAYWRINQSDGAAQYSDWTSGVWFLTGQDFSLRHKVQTGCGLPWFFARGIKRQGREANHSRLSSAEVKNAWSYTFTPPYTCMAWCLAQLDWAWKWLVCRRFWRHTTCWRADTTPSVSMSEMVRLSLYLIKHMPWRRVEVWM
jgi:hypothetical protein